MLTLGIHDGHTATACLMEDGEILACISEERLNKEKEWAGFPEQSIRECLCLAGRSAEEIDRVGVCSLMPQIGSYGYHNPAWYKRLFGAAVRLLPDRALQSPANVNRVRRLSGMLFGGRRHDIVERLGRMGIPEEKVAFYDHHRCHAATTYYLSWNRDRGRNLVITLDGSGDGVCATINIGDNGRLETIAETFNYNSICEFYTRVTQYLGMKPMAHEFKVMGLAPYASGYGKDDMRNLFRSWFSVSPDDPLQVVNTSGAWKWQFLDRMRRELGFTRFDTIAGATQEVFEEICLQWIRNAIRETGIGNVALSGGGFMNVKLNYVISELPEVESLFVFPSCGDESNPIGACALAALDAGFDYRQIRSMGMPYWGHAYGEEEIRKAIDERLAGLGLGISRHDDVNQALAERLVAGKVAGRFTGRMEWGARALGNRSIVADPRNSQIIHKINKAIKMRDFWMPFAPAILVEYRERYVKLRPDYHCPHMTIAPETHEEAHDAIPAGLHPFDRTARCQILDPENHPSFHDLVTKFERMSGIGGVLNTSFNLHGDPIVMSPEDAIRTFLDSGLEVLQLENWLIEK